MNKYKSILIKKLEEEKVKKDNIKKIDDDTILIEKDNSISLILKFSISILRLVLELCILILAFMGLISLIYPELRYILFSILENIYKEFLMLIS